MRLGDSRSISSLLLALLALAVGGLSNDGHAQPVPVTDIENAAGDSVLTVFEDGGFAVYGEEGTGTIPIEGEGTRMMWYPEEAAFRVGEVLGDKWNEFFVARWSVAMGLDTEASSLATTAMGRGTRASGVHATAMGDGTVASGGDATSMGLDTQASGNRSTAMGNDTAASGDEATAMGGFTNAVGQYSTAMGRVTTATGKASTAMGGNGVTASGNRSTAMGNQTTASGTNSTAMGSVTEAATDVSLSIGRYNDANTSDDNTLLVAGNGFSNSNRSDALVLDQNGNLEISGTLTENSDRRLKEQIQPLGSGVLGNLGEIEPVRFRFKDERTHPLGTQIGLIAQEVQAQFPALVSEAASGHLSVSYSKFTSVLLKGLQEQQAEIERLEAKVNRVDQLGARLAKLEAQDASRLAALGGPWSAAALLAIGLLGLGLFVQRQQRA